MAVGSSSVRRDADQAAHHGVEGTVGQHWKAIDAEAVDSGRPEVAVDIGNAISVDLFSPPIFAALCSPDLGTAATRLATHKPLVGPLRVSTSTDDVGRLSISYQWPAGTRPPALLATAELIFWVALARIGARELVTAVRVTAPDWVPRSSLLREFFGVPLSKSDEFTVVFSVADSRRPFLNENDQMWRIFAPELRRRLHDLPATASVADRVRAALVESLPAGDPSIDAVTGRLAMSARTLQRHLKAEGTSFQSVLADTRESLARHYLRTGELRTSEIAYLLGYEDTNSFYRAFRSWTGSTPETIRSELSA